MIRKLALVALAAVLLIVGVAGATAAKPVRKMVIQPAPTQQTIPIHQLRITDQLVRVEIDRAAGCQTLPGRDTWTWPVPVADHTAGQPPYHILRLYTGFVGKTGRPGVYIWVDSVATAPPAVNASSAVIGDRCNARAVVLR